MTDICFVDTETTGLDADRHEPWEVGLIRRQYQEPKLGQPPAFIDTEFHWFLPVDLGRADPVALAIGGFHNRHPQGHAAFADDAGVVPSTPLSAFARAFALYTQNTHLVGAVISFDEERLRWLLKENGACPEWHYHLIDVEAMAVGHLVGEGYLDARRLPWDSKQLSEALGIQPEKYDVHTALGDARWARDLYDRVTRYG